MTSAQVIDLESLQAEYDNMLRCIRCAACLTACPTYVVTHKEEEGPRGRIAIMRAIVEGQLDVTPDAVTHLDNCLLCEACTNVCPSGIEMERMGIAFRDSLTAGKTSEQPLAARLAFSWLFGDLGHFRLLARLMWLYQRSGAQWLARNLGILKLMRMQDSESLLPRVPSRFVTPKGQSVGEGPTARIFAGCIMSTAFAPTTEATARVVAAFGSRAEMTAGQVCCGALQAHSGAVERARELARQNLDAFGDGDEPIIVNAAGCGAMLKHYAALLPDESRAARFAARVKDVSEFLAGKTPRRPPRELDLTVAIQDPCHLLHAQRVSSQPRQLLRAIPGVKTVEIAEGEVCCGSAGIYNVTHQGTAAELQQRKCANIVATGCDAVVTGNPGCFVQIQAGLPKTIQVRHIVDVLDEAYTDAGLTT
ncbi:MAG: (Fe-S)-binding protein [Chloroflexi bacterium]|nr:(Fe-S)-binding protein [Chloroflexota bacterium]